MQGVKLLPQTAPIERLDLLLDQLIMEATEVTVLTEVETYVGLDDVHLPNTTMVYPLNTTTGPFITKRTTPDNPIQ